MSETEREQVREIEKREREQKGSSKRECVYGKRAKEQERERERERGERETDSERERQRESKAKNHKIKRGRGGQVFQP